MLHAEGVEQLADTVGGSAPLADNPTHITRFDGYRQQDTSLIHRLFNADMFWELNEVLDDEPCKKLSVVHDAYFFSASSLPQASSAGMAADGSAVAPGKAESTAALPVPSSDGISSGWSFGR